MSISFNTREPVYVQVVRYFKEQIATGKLTAGQEIPSRRELGATLKINPNTAQRAYKEMEEQQLIHTERNRPSRVTDDEYTLKAVRQELIVEAIDTLIASVRPIQVPFEELMTIMEKRYHEEDFTHD